MNKQNIEEIVLVQIPVLLLFGYMIPNKKNLNLCLSNLIFKSFLIFKSKLFIMISTTQSYKD